MKTLFPGLREVFVKDPKGNRVGYFEDLETAINLLTRDAEYRAAFFSLNVSPRIPDGFVPNRFYRASSRFRKGDYARRQLLLVDCDPRREADTSSTGAQKATAHRQVLAIREFLRNLGFTEPVLADSGNGFHLLYSIDEPNDEATETLIRNFLAGLAARFSDDDCNVDTGNFEANRASCIRRGRVRATIRVSGASLAFWKCHLVISNYPLRTAVVGKQSRM